MDELVKTLAGQGPFVVGAIVLIGMFLKGTVVTGREFDRQVQAAEKWEAATMEILHEAKRATRVAEAVANQGAGARKKKPTTRRR